MNYRLIGIDLDGTLLDPRGRISGANRDAIAAAQAAGAMVVPCTGRAWHESHYLLKDVPGLELGVFITGACVADIASGASVDLALVEPGVAREAVEVLRPEPEAVLVFRESSRAGHHYLVTGDGKLTDNTRWWFELTGAQVHFQRGLTLRDLHHTLRVGMVAPGSRVQSLEAKVAGALGGRVQVHSFAALNHESARETVAILEVFAAGAHKWRGLSYVAQQHGIEPHEIATVGDEVNDIAMLESAGCGIAMGNAADAAKRCAAHVTHSNRDDGVAHALHEMIAGRW